MNVVAQLDAVWCDRHQRHHQARERRVPCSACGALTDDPHALCGNCQEEVATT